MCTTLYFYFCILYHQKFNFHLSPYSWSLYPFCPPFPSIPSLLVTTTLFSVSTCLFLFNLVSSFILIFYLFLIFQIWVKSSSIFSFSIWLISLNIIPSRFLHIVTMARFHLFMAESYSYYMCIYIYIYIHIIYIPHYYIYHIMYIPHFLIHSSTDGHLGCFHTLAIVNMP